MVVLAPEHAESQRLADILNRLAANKLAGTAPFVAELQGHASGTPQDLIAALVATGHDVGSQIISQLGNYPNAWLLASGIVGLFGLVPGMPHIPFLVFATLFSYFGLARRKWQQGEAND